MFNHQARWDRRMPGDGQRDWEKAEVFCRFAKGRIIPLRFMLGSSGAFVISRVNYSWTQRHGSGVLYFFSVSDNRDTYRLCLDSESMSWRAAPLQ